MLVEHTKQLTSLDEAKMAERMTTAEMMREHNRMRLERGDSSVSAPAAGSENPELAHQISDECWLRRDERAPRVLESTLGPVLRLISDLELTLGRRLRQSAALVPAEPSL